MLVSRLSPARRTALLPATPSLMRSPSTPAWTGVPPSTAEDHPARTPPPRWPSKLRSRRLGRLGAAAGLAVRGEGLLPLSSWRQHSWRLQLVAVAGVGDRLTGLRG